MNEDKFSRIIADLLIESEDSENPDPQHNAYNWGLVHAEMALRGVPVNVIKKLQKR
jgi:hypothetical protein